MPSMSRCIGRFSPGAVSGVFVVCGERRAGRHSQAEEACVGVGLPPSCLSVVLKTRNVLLLKEGEFGRLLDEVGQ
jgi:hypothetical protein